MPSTHGRPKPASVIGGILITVLGVLALFWVSFGYVDGYAFGVAAFFVLMQLAIVLVPKKLDALGPGAASKVPPGRFDFLGAVWLLTIPFAPFFGWVLTNWIDVDASNWRVVLGIRAFACVILPCVCVLPLLRYVRGQAAGFASAILVVGTAFPVITGAGSAFDLVMGPEWESVVISQIEDVSFTTRVGTHVEARGAFVLLSDGRRFTRATEVKVETGPAKLLLLRGFGRIIGAG